MSQATNELIFRYTLPALGFNTYFFESQSGNKLTEIKSNVNENDACTLQNQNIRVEIDAQGNLKTLINLRENINITFANQGFFWYQSMFSVFENFFCKQNSFLGFAGNNSGFDFHASGAYVFRPVVQSANPIGNTRSM